MMAVPFGVLKPCWRCLQPFPRIYVPIGDESQTGFFADVRYGSWCGALDLLLIFSILLWILNTVARRASWDDTDAIYELCMAFQKFWFCCLGRWVNYRLFHLKAESCFYCKTPNCIWILLCSATSRLFLPISKQDRSVVCSLRKWFYIISCRGFCWSGLAVKKQLLLSIL